MKTIILTAFSAIFVSVFFISAGVCFAQDTAVRTPEAILEEMGETPTVEAICELFINCSEWDESHNDVQTPSREALVELGVVVVPTILERWLSSVDLRRRIELDNIIWAIGYPAAGYLIPYLEASDYTTRRHAAYLLGDTAYIQSLDDPLALGPLNEDLPAIEALTGALSVEANWQVLSSLVGAIGKMRDPGRIEEIAAYLNHDEQAVRLAAVISLGRIPDQLVVPHLIRAFSDPMINVRQAAVLAISTETMGNSAFEAIIGTSILSPHGTQERLCALESLARYLEIIASDRNDRANEQRKRAFDTATTIIDNALLGNAWQVRGYAVWVIGWTYYPDAEIYLKELADNELHPFVIGKINEAINRLEKGQPEPAE